MIPGSELGRIVTRSSASGNFTGACSGNVIWRKRWKYELKQFEKKEFCISAFFLISVGSYEVIFISHKCVSLKKPCNIKCISNLYKLKSQFVYMQTQLSQSEFVEQ